MRKLLTTEAQTQQKNVSKTFANYTEYHAPFDVIKHKHLKKNSLTYSAKKKLKLILAPAGDYRGTGMVERLIQAIKRRLAVLDMNPNWSNTTLANRLTNIIENIRLIPNTTTKISLFEAHFGRKPSTEISNITTKTSHKNITYKNLTK